MITLKQSGFTGESPPVAMSLLGTHNDLAVNCNQPSCGEVILQRQHVQNQKDPVPTFPPGLGPPPGMPSHGSALHYSGHCRPCAWFWKPTGCRNGEDCAHCHLCLDGEIRLRKSIRQTLVRMLGIVTPKQQATSNSLRFMPSDKPVVNSRGSELESTTGSGSDQEWTRSPCSGSEHDLGGDSDQDEVAEPAMSHLKSLWSFGPGLPLGEEFPPGLESPHGSELSLGDQFAQDHGLTSDTVALGPRDPPSSAYSSIVSSLGSLLHGSGDCRPCAWFWKPTGCANNQACDFCHLCPQGAAKARKKSRRFNAAHVSLADASVTLA